MSVIQPITNIADYNTAAGAGCTGMPSPAASGNMVNEKIEALEVCALQQNFRLQFSVDEPTGKTVITVINADTEKVIRVIPPEESLKVAARIQQMVENIIDVMI